MPYIAVGVPGEFATQAEAEAAHRELYADKPKAAKKKAAAPADPIAKAVEAMEEEVPRDLDS